jgi:hypothetical protein
MKAGISQKQKKMSICHRPINLLGNKDVGDFAARCAGETNPTGLRYAVGIRYNDFDKNKPK